MRKRLASSLLLYYPGDEGRKTRGDACAVHPDVAAIAPFDFLQRSYPATAFAKVIAAALSR